MERLTSSFTRLDKLNGAHQALPIIPATPSGCQRIKGDLQAVVRGMQAAVLRLRAGERPGASLEKSPPPSPPFLRWLLLFRKKLWDLLQPNATNVTTTCSPDPARGKGKKGGVCSCVKQGDAEMDPENEMMSVWILIKKNIFVSYETCT